jgi:hypothetical protein
MGDKAGVLADAMAWSRSLAEAFRLGQRIWSETAPSRAPPVFSSAEIEVGTGS